MGIAARRLRVVHNLDMDTTDPEAAAEGRAFHCEAQLVVESDAGDFTAQRTPQWHVVSLNLLSGDEPAPDPRNPPQPGAPRGPRSIRQLEIRD